ncbi:TonB-dependent receptor domain-containing protein [Massilia niastensis]|uniref:TonB-dependent receptor domain-containing protein n=1 Tax=Massilia niastensis TaxID=544911 RepID=UPI0003762D6D|nr:TonB-dependent receptor [Massilia niastensis]
MPMRRSSTSFVPTPPIAATPGIPFPRSAVALAVLCALAAGPACAQAGAADPAAPASVEPVAEVVITGSQIRGVSAAGSKSVVLDRETLLQTGYNNPIDVLKTVPQVQGLGYGDTQTTAQNGGANVQRGNTISLRGLSPSATLVLIDGRRIAPTGNVTTFTEANQLPVSFIERIDVVADGASAIYGSDAIAGVVNYITRKSYDGVEITPRYTHTQGYDQKGASIVAGHTVKRLGGMGKLSIVAAFDHDQRDALLQGASPFTRQDLSPLGGLDNRIRTNLASSGAPGNIIVAGPSQNPLFPSAGNFTYYGIPPGYGGTGLTGAGLLRNQPNLLDASDHTDLLPETKRNQASLNLNLQIDATTRLYYQAYYNRRENTILGLIQPTATLTLPASSPYYVPGVPGVAPGAPQTVSFSFLKDVGRGIIGSGHSVASGHGNTVGLQLDFDNKWRAEAIFTATGTRTCANCIPALNGNIFTQQLQAALNDGSYNPFSSAPASPAVLGRFLVEGNDRNRVKMQQASLRFDGPLFALPGGMVRAAVGAESLGIEQWRDSIGIKQTADTIGAYGKRRINAVYGELSVPLVGPGNSLPLMQRFSLNLAGRAQRYSDVGSTSNPKIGFVWGVNGDLALRGAAGTSFRAPDLTDANASFFSSVSTQLLTNNANDPAIPLSNAGTRQSYVLRLGGSNPALTPEKARNFSLGADYKPSFIDGLRLGGSVYRIEYENQIIGLQTVSGSFLASAANRAVYAPYITPAAQPAGCIPGNRSTYNPIYAAAFGEPSLSAPDESNACRLTALFTARNTNAASTVQDGVDLDIGYEVETAHGRFHADLNATRILHNRVKVSPLAGETDDLDRMNVPVSVRGRGALGWTQGQWSANLAMNYVGSYLNDLPVTIAGVTNPKVEIDAWKTFDLHLAWRSAAKGGLFGGTRLSFNIQNVFDRDPPLVLSTNNNAAFAYDAQNANVLGRIVSLQLSKAFF